MDAFILQQHNRIKCVPEETFRFIKETPALNDLMPMNLVWMEKSIENSRYYAVPKLVRVTPKNALPELSRQAEAFIRDCPIVAVKCFHIDQEEGRLCILPNKIFPRVSESCVNQLASFVEYQVDNDMDFIFGTEVSKRHDTLQKFGYVKDDGEIDFDLLRCDFVKYRQRVDDQLRASREELRELAGRIVMRKALTNSVDRNQYSLDLEIIKKDLLI